MNKNLSSTTIKAFKWSLLASWDSHLFILIFSPKKYFGKTCLVYILSLPCGLNVDSEFILKAAVIIQFDSSYSILAKKHHKHNKYRPCKVVRAGDDRT